MIVLNIFFTFFLIAVSLSMDAFSLAIIYGTYGISVKKQIILSMIVGIFHFFMPLIGLWFGNVLKLFLEINSNFIVGGLFFIIGVEMILSIKSGKEVNFLASIWGFLLFGFTVSLDSLTVGIGLSLITTYYFVAAFMFMVVSSMFTFFGLRFGLFFNKSFGKYACLFGGVIMIMLSFYYIFL